MRATAPTLLVAVAAAAGPPTGAPPAPTIGCGTRFQKTGKADLLINPNSSAFDSYNIMHPLVAQVAGRWLMYYSGGPDSGMPGYHNHQLGLASAAQPTGPWRRHGAPLLPLGPKDADHDHGPPTLLRGETNAALLEDGLFTMLYTGNKNNTIFRATSANGLAWRKAGPIGLDGYAPSVLRVNGLLWLFYVAPDPHNGGMWSIMLARGADWGSLQKLGAVIVTNTQPWEQNKVFYPYVLYEKAAGWTMGYSAYANRSVIGLPPKGTSGTLAGATGLAHSADGVSWVKCPANPVLAPTPGSDYDSIYTTQPSIVTVDERGAPLPQPLMFYGGRIDFPKGVEQHKYYSVAHAVAEAPR